MMSGHGVISNGFVGLLLSMSQPVLQSALDWDPTSDGRADEDAIPSSTLAGSDSDASGSFEESHHGDEPGEARFSDGPSCDLERFWSADGDEFQPACTPEARREGFQRIPYIASPIQRFFTPDPTAEQSSGSPTSPRPWNKVPPWRDSGYKGTKFRKEKRTRASHKKAGRQRL